MAAQSRFGGTHTAHKLDIVEDYCQSYLQVLSKQNFETAYVDTFAGTGKIPISDDNAPTFQGMADLSELEGSALRAIQLDRGFNRYLFADKSKKKILELESEIRRAAPERLSFCRFQASDANDVLREFVESTNWRQTRAVVFLDPFGNQINWGSVDLLARTGAVDLWYFFPVGHGVSRQIGKDGKINDDAASSIDALLGDSRWRTIFSTATLERDLLGDITWGRHKMANPGLVTEFVLDRLREVFGDGVYPEPIPMGRSKRFEYALFFACANPAGRQLAHRLANGVIKKHERYYLGRPK